MNAGNTPTESKKMSASERTRSRARLSGLAAIGLAMALGVGAFAGFTDTDSATRAVDNGQLDIQVAPQLLSVYDIAPGDMMSRGLVVDIPTATNDGDLIDFLEVTFAGSTANTCDDVNTTCDVPEANLLGGEALTIAMLACPGTGTDASDWVTGRIADASPTVDDDSDPATDSRMDGMGPYTCSTGDFTIIPAGGNIVCDFSGCLPEFPNQVLFDSAYALTYPGGPGGSGFFLDPYTVGALASLDQGSNDRFVDGSQIEMVSCIAMNDDIGTVDWDLGYQGENVPDGLFDNDYENLSANIEFTFDAFQGGGEILPRDREVTDNDPQLFLAKNCESLIPSPPIDPFVDGNNTIQGRSWYEKGFDIYSDPASPGFGWYEDTGLDPAFDDFFVDQEFDLTYDPDGPDEQTITVSSSETDGYKIDTLVDGNYRITATNLYGLLPPGLGTDPSLDSDLIRGTPENPNPFDWSDGHLDFSISGGQVQNYWIGLINVPA